jgi:hypothetical protein
MRCTPKMYKTTEQHDYEIKNTPKRIHDYQKHTLWEARI